MIIVYASKTHNVERFCKKIKRYESVRVEDYDPSMGEYVLITYTTGFGEAPTAINNAKAYIDPKAKVQPKHSTSLF